MAATWSESASCRSRINCAPHRCKIPPDRGADLSAERRTGRDGDEMVDPHLKMIREVTPSAEGCEDRLRIGSRWVHLRLSVGKLRLLHDLL